MNATTTITTAPLELLKLDPVNPRTDIDPERIAWLTESIKKHGVISPLLVREAAGGGYFVIAGQRRMIAAGDAGLTEVPIFIRDANGDAGTLAVVENLEREQLTPIEEANAFKRAVDDGMTVEELAGAVSRSEQLIKDRLALLELPVKVQATVASGAVTLGAAAGLRKVAAAGPAVLEKVAELLARGDDDWDAVTPKSLEEDPAGAVDTALDELGKKAPFLVELHKDHSLSLDGPPWPKTVDVKALTAKLNQVSNEYDPKTYTRPRSKALNVTQADVDAARAYGCLIEIPTGSAYRHSGLWVNDPVWLADRISDKLDRAIAAQARKVGKKPAAGAAAPTADAAEKERRDATRAENLKKRRATLAKREKNVTLGIALYKELHAPSISLDAMRILAELIAEYAAEDLGRNGLRFVDEAAQTVETLKNGTIKNVKYLKGHGEVKKLLKERIAKATTPEQILGALLQAIVAAKYADVEAAPTNDRHGRVRGLGSDHYSSRNETLIELVEKIAQPVLPAGTAKTKKRSTASKRGSARRPAARRRAR